MSPIAPAFARLGAEVGDLTARIGWRVEAERMGVLDREGHLRLGPPSHISPNGGCRLVQAADGWIAVNLAREEDHDLIPAWLGCDFGPEAWELVEAHVGEHRAADLVAGAELLGLPVAAVGEVVRDTMEAPRLRMAAGGARAGKPKVVELSALWAGPVCGAILAAMGAEVLKVESSRRPDPTRTKTPDFFRRVNAGKTWLSLDLTEPDGQARLREAILAADILVTGSRPRAFASLGLDPAALFAEHPGLVWAAVTGYGWTGPGANRVAFGDDAAAAGGLVDWTPQGPKFLGDALADPVTGLAAAAGALKGFEEGGGVLVDVSLAGSAAGAAHVCRLRRAA